MENTVTLKCTLNHDFPPANKASTNYLALEILPPPGSVQIAVLPSAICLLIDHSGSMKGDRLNKTKAAAVELLRNMAISDYVGLITFSGIVEEVLPVSAVSSMAAIEVEKAIKAIKASGGTELYKALDAAYLELKNLGDAGNLVKRIILISDGESTDHITLARYSELARQIREAGISVTALGVGKDYSEDVLGSIAEHSGGMWKHISSPTDLPDIFAKQIEEAKTIVQTMPVIKLQLSLGVEVQEIFQASPQIFRINEMKKEGNTYHIPVLDIMLGDSQVLAMKLSLPSRPAGECRIARIEIAGKPASAQEIIATYTDNAGLYEKENNVFPRGAFLSAETQHLTRLGLEGDKTALWQAELQADTILMDTTLANVPTVVAGAQKAHDTIVQSQKGMDSEETKIAKQNITKTETRRKK